MKKIITISREFGSGGRTIAKAVAEQLGYKYYDKELIEKVADKTGFSAKFVEEQGEYAPNTAPFAYSFVGRGINGVSPEDYLWSAQRRVILQIADEEPCVIVGRCADYILRNREDCLHVFIHADMKKRAERIVKLYGETDKTPEKRLQEKDKKRKINYKYYTEQDWGMSQNYDLSLDSGVIGLDRCVDLIVELAQEL